jgi:glutamate 5-kinase
MGMHRLEIEERPTYLRDKQACAAVGQSRLMSVYQQAFDRFESPTAQILLTEDDFASRKRYLNLRNTMSRLLELGVLPIVNENDSISTSEIEEAVGDSGRAAVFGDNDQLSALVASKLEADLLLLLSDVDGLLPRSPVNDADEKTLTPLSLVSEITDEVLAMAIGTAAGNIEGKRSNSRGRGGMASKLDAIKIAVQSGVSAVIANGFEPGTIGKVLGGENVGTLFAPKKRLRGRKHWIAFASASAGSARVNDGAKDALIHRGSSLLFSGVEHVDGDFNQGDVVSIVDASGNEFARGMSNYGADRARLLVGKGRAEIAAEVGADCPELITRDNIALKF